MSNRKSNRKTAGYTEYGQGSQNLTNDAFEEMEGNPQQLFDYFKQSHHDVYREQL